MFVNWFYLGRRHRCQLMHIFRYYFYGLHLQVWPKLYSKQLEFCKIQRVRGAILWPAGCDGQFLAKTSLLQLHRGRLILHLYISQTFLLFFWILKNHNEILLDFLIHLVEQIGGTNWISPSAQNSICKNMSAAPKL